MYRIVVEAVHDVLETSASGQRVDHRCNVRARLDGRGDDLSVLARLVDGLPAERVTG
jgi:hypothetical protein